MKGQKGASTVLIVMEARAEMMMQGLKSHSRHEANLQSVHLIPTTNQKEGLVAKDQLKKNLRADHLQTMALKKILQITLTVPKGRSVQNQITIK